MSTNTPTDGWHTTQLWSEFLDLVPRILAGQDPQTGRFGTEPFIVGDQNVMYALAVAWAGEPAGVTNPFHHRDDILTAIVAAGDALLEVADSDGKFEFRKKDNSTWGWIHMPWTYSRWIRAWGLVRDAMPAERREAWDAALIRAVEGIIATELQGRIHNIPAHHAMAVFRASQVLDRPDWAQVAVDFLHRVTDAQQSGGYWSEHQGPVVAYNLVYVDALGSYYAMSGDPDVLPALQAAAEFHANLTYPDGTLVETVDERNLYRHAPAQSSVGFTFSELGRGLLAWLQRFGPTQEVGGSPAARADALAALIGQGASGPIEQPAAVLPHHSFLASDGMARVERAEPWFVVLSAYHCAPPEARWIQDRQSHLSVFHDRVGLVLSGSNTRLQPRWSTFTVGDPHLLQHRGEEEPDFTAPDGLEHLPTTASLSTDGWGVDLVYGEVPCQVRVELDGERALLAYRVDRETDAPVAAHAAFVAQVGKEWQAGEHHGVLGETPIRLTGAEHGGRFSHAGWRLELPEQAILEWPVRPHNPYAKHGAAPLDQARIVVSVPVGTSEPARITITVD